MTTPSNSRSFGSSTSNYPPASSSSDYSPTSTSTPFATPATRATSIAPSTFSRSGPGNRRAKFAMLSSNAADNSPLQAIHASPTPTGSRSATPASMDDHTAASSVKDEGEGASSFASSSTTTLNARASVKPGVRARLAASTTASTPGSKLTPSSSSASKLGATAAATAPSSEMSKDAEDFFARAQAMGLRLTREDYERTKAGVAAFLKAERRPFTPTATATTASSSTTSSKATDVKPSSSSQTAQGPTKTTASSDSSVDAAKTNELKAGPSQPRLSVPSPMTRPGGATWSRNTSSPGLSFFTAVIEPQDSPGSPKIHPSLDQIGNAEERRRLKLKKLKLRQRRERERALSSANAASSSSKVSQHLLATPNSTAAPFSPASSSAFRTPPARTDASKAGSSSAKSATRVGLGLDLNGSDSTSSPDPVTPPEALSSAFSSRSSRIRSVSFEASPVIRVSDEVRECDSLEELSRRAWVSPRGTLRLLKSPVEHDAVFCSPPVDVDDAVACFAIPDARSPAIGGLAADGWGAVHRRAISESSTGTAAPANLEGLDAKMSGLSFLDRIMSKQTSPRRLYKAEKLRQREAAERKIVEEQVQAELAVQQMAEAAARAEYEQEEAVKAAAAADAIKAANPDYASLVLSTPNGGNKTRKAPDSVVRATPVESSSSRALRWTTIGGSPSNLHMRMTTREHYDFTMHGISPSQPGYDSLDSLCNIHSTPGPITFHAWDAEPLTSLRKGTDANRSSLRGSSAFTPASHFLLGADEHRPELIGVSPSVASFFHARQASAQGSANSSLMRSSSQGAVVMSPLSGRLVSGVASRISDLDFEADDEINMHHDDATAAGKPSGFNAKRGLLFSAPGGTALDPPPASLAEALHLDEGASKTFAMSTSSPMRLSRSLRAGTAGDQMIGGKLPFASPRSAITRSESTTAVETRHGRQPSGNIRDFLGNATRHKRGLSRKIDTISPADVFGSSLPRTASAPSFETRLPLPEPSKGVRDAVNGPQADLQDASDHATHARNKKAKKAAEVRRVQSDSPPSPSKQLAQAEQVVLMQPPVELTSVGVHLMHRAGSAEPAMSSFANGAKAPAAIVDAEVKGASQSASAKKTKKTKSAGGSAPASAAAKVIDLPCQDFERMAKANPSFQNGDEIGWDQPDGSRLVKLVSEELKAALDAGTLLEEPPARYYLLPPGFGQSKAKPSSVSYAGLIGQAIKSSSDMRLSLSEVYDWISSTYPFFEKGDRGWQNSIRHNLSLNKSFVKIEREANMPGKGGWWGIKPGHEDRFQNGLYNAVPQKFEAAKARQQQQQQNQANKMASSPEAVESELVVSDAAVALPCSQSSESVDGSAKKRSKAKRKKVQMDDAVESGDESDKESSRPSSSKKVKAQAHVMMADRLPLLETQPQNGMSLGGGPMAINGLDSITPVRPHLGSSIYGSSIAGSSYSKPIPGLIDSASSPPSSPMTLMPPPSLQATANHSARKRKMAGQGNGQLSYGPGFSPSLYAMRGGGLGGAFAFPSGMETDTSRGSPLRRQTKGENAPNNSSVTSPKRLWSISSPMSSMRGHKGHMDDGMRSPTSTARVAAALARSPIRSSPLRSGAAGMLSPNSSASLQMQLAMGGGAGQMGFNGAGFGAGLGMGSGLTPGRTPGSLRFSSGMSPGRRGFASNGPIMGMSLAGAAPQTMQQQGWYLDDPFEMQANLQHQHQHQQMVHHHQIHPQSGHGSMDSHYSGFGSIGDGITTSPLRQAWNSIQAAGGIQAFTGSHGFSQAGQ
ncbi:Transcription factor, fork head [Kalmanozyma brasiliensis GHG001]|uniref:Fork-head domain-containing protein n=1 Tax=Kalmanozyma brasiliensis (strain GHG001) TaxID=1365824 RepID=V5E7R2_KALBG|nr:Transcription factor, fork head [Kalmanozyma brasiliensis GHG001]EST06351.1 Transcription factor, fork head [Kalmanozyma brasiliensis GHG001]